MATYKNTYNVILKTIVLVIACIFLSNNNSPASTLESARFTLAPPSAIKPSCEIIRKSDGSFDVVTHNEVTKPQPQVTAGSYEEGTATPEKAFRDKWVFTDISYLIGQVLVFTVEHELQNPKEILISIVKKYIRNRGEDAKILLGRLNVDKIEEVREGEKITGFSFHITENNVLTYKLVYSLQSGDALVSFSDKVRVYVSIVPIENIQPEKNIFEAISNSDDVKLLRNLWLNYEQTCGPITQIKRLPAAWRKVYLVITDKGSYVLRSVYDNNPERAKAFHDVTDFLRKHQFKYYIPTVVYTDKRDVCISNNDTYYMVTDYKDSSTFTSNTKNLFANLSNAQLEACAEMLAHYHIIISKFNPDAFLFAKKSDCFTLITERLEKLKKIQEEGEYKTEQENKDSAKFYANHLEFVIKEMEEFIYKYHDQYKKCLSKIYIHGDFQGCNILSDGGDGVSGLVDFDNMRYDSALIDMIAGIIEEEPMKARISIEKLEVFLKAYLRIRQLDENELRSLSMLFKLNCLTRISSYLINKDKIERFDNNGYFLSQANSMLERIQILNSQSEEINELITSLVQKPLWQRPEMQIKNYDVTKDSISMIQIKQALFDNYDLGVREAGDIKLEKFSIGTTNREPIKIHAPNGDFALKYAGDDQNKTKFIVSVIQHAFNNNIPSANIYPTKNGTYVLQIGTLYYYLEEFVKGKTIKRSDMTSRNFNTIGQLIARLHNALQGYKPDGGKQAMLSIDIVSAEEDLLKLKRELMAKSGDLSRAENLFLSNVDFIINQIVYVKENLPLSKYRKLPQITIHGDVKAANLLWDDNGNKILALLDWERARPNQARIEDFKNALFADDVKLIRKYEKEKLATLLEAYQEQSIIKLTTDELDALSCVLGGGTFLWDLSRWFVLKIKDLDKSDYKYKMVSRLIETYREVVNDFNSEWWSSEKRKILKIGSEKTDVTAAAENKKVTNLKAMLAYIQTQSETQPVMIVLGTSWIKGYEKRQC
ncbi:MAG: phosphotransferase, partial [Candidatus Omnitrophica bacterium]|nr:phosphotransferase [Candidatus Omnitrophota bacterium]